MTTPHLMTRFDPLPALLIVAAQTHFERRDWRGECYNCAAELVLRYPDLDLRLVHGEPLGTGGEAAGLRYGHAWIEYGELVFDLTVRAAPIPRAAYYRGGSIDAAAVRRYGAAEINALTAAHEHWGPWSGPYVDAPLGELVGGEREG